MTGLGFAAAILYGGWQGIYGNVTLGAVHGLHGGGAARLPAAEGAGDHQAHAERGPACRRARLRADRLFLARHRKARRQAAESHGGRDQFRDVDFAYDGGGPVLVGLQPRHRRPGRKLALVGPSGAGKSTVLNLILRFFDPRSGAILIDGQDLRDVDLASVRGASALLTQDPVLFDDTIAANIAYGSEGRQRGGRSSRRRRRRRRTISSAACRTATRRTSARRATGFPAASASASPSRAPCSATRRSCSSTSRPARSTRNRRRRCRPRWSGCCVGRTVVMIAHRLSTVQKADRDLLHGGRAHRRIRHACRAGGAARQICTHGPDAASRRRAAARRRRRLTSRRRATPEGCSERRRCRSTARPGALGDAACRRAASMARAAAARRMQRGAASGSGSPARSGRAGPLVWVHAASVGETIAALPLVEPPARAASSACC